MKIATFNVNGVNGRLLRLLEWLAQSQPDVACLQEIKTSDASFPIDAIESAGYGAIWYGQPRHHGVAILARGAVPVEIRRGLPGDESDAQARYQKEVERYKKEKEEITPEAKPVTLGNGQKTVPWAGEAFARYSPDGLHWSNWQVMVCDRKRTDARAFSGEITVPQRERREYGEFLSEYAKLDVPWRSDEEAAVGWILKRAPDFFGRSLPFIGYVELLFEFPFQGGQRLTKLQASAAYGMSGVHYPPKDESVFNGRQTPWRFKAQ